MMRKAFVFIAVLFLAGAFGWSQAAAPGTQDVLTDAAEVLQTLVPIEVYVGDTAEIRYRFRSAVDFFPDSIIEKEIDVQKIPFGALSELFTIKNAHFSRNDMEYTLSLRMIPWRPGVVEFPVFDLFSVLGLKEEDKNENASYAIALEPIEIKSIVEKTGRNEIQPPHSPLIIPGTTYIIFGVVVVSIILLVAIFRILLRFGDLKRWITHLKIRYAYRRNSIIAMRKIKRLLKSSNLSDIEFCAGLQNVTRAYLAFRFDYPFASVSAVSVRDVFNKICFGEIPASIAYSVEDLTSMFIRTDYIRYAHDSIDSKREPQSEHKAALAKNERKSLAEMVAKAIKVFESDGQDEEASNVF